MTRKHVLRTSLLPHVRKRVPSADSAVASLLPERIFEGPGIDEQTFEELHAPTESLISVMDTDGSGCFSGHCC